MKRPGDILRKRREELGLSLLELESNSNIPRRSLEAMERDEYDFFPAESYYRGFLKNYAENLKLDPKILLNAYQNVKIIESPLPMEQLTGKNQKSKFRPLYIGIGSLCLIIIGLISYFISQPLQSTEDVNEEQSVAKLDTPPDDAIVKINRYPWMQNLENGMVLRFILDTEQNDLLQPEMKVTQVGQDFRLVSLNLEQKHELNLANSKTNSLPLRLADTNANSFRLDFTLQTKKALLINLGINKNQSLLTDFEGTLGAKFKTFQTKNKKSKPRVILQVKKPVPLQLQLTFGNDSYVRYEWSEQDAQEFPVLKNKVLLLQGKAPLILWLSDVKATKVKINGQDLKLKAVQNVFVGRFAWKREVNVSRLYLHVDS